MNRNGGQASSAVLRADCNIIWLPGAARHNAAAPLEAREAGMPSASPAPRGLAARPLKALVLTAAVAAQAVALAIVLTAGGAANPWASGAAFGIAAAIASWAGVQIAGRFAQGSAPRAIPQDLALHDAFTLALIMAASGVLGGIGAALLLPAGIVLSLTMRRMVRRSAATGQDAVLLLIVAIAMAGVCGPLGFQAWGLAGIALAAAVMVRAGHSCLRPPVHRQIWRLWGMSALMCAAIALAEQARLGLPAAVRLTDFMPLLAGAIYGAGAGIAARILSRRYAQALSAAVPFLAVAVEIAFGDAVPLPLLAAAILLAAALAGSRYYPKARRNPVVAAANAWPAGWPQ